MDRRAIGAILIVVTIIAVFVWPTPYTYRHEPGRKQRLMRINRITQRVSVLVDGSWIDARNADDVEQQTVTDARENARLDHLFTEESRRFSSDERKKVTFQPTKLHGQFPYMVDYTLYNGTDRRIRKLRLNLLLTSLNDSRLMQRYEQQFEADCIVAPGSWFSGTAKLDNYPPNFDGLSWWADIADIKEDDLIEESIRQP